MVISYADDKIPLDISFELTDLDFFHILSN